MSDDESTHRAVRWELGWEEREQLKRLLREGGSYCGAPEVLIAAGADLSVVVSDGDTALDKAIFWEHVECEQLLRSHGAAMAAKPVVVVGRGGVGLAALHAGSH
ncbi:hypothetical protein EMIHUDRAFT_206887 [Emiliania huxleyi CCMP1516]|uniref:Uncharacterized protein n=2 Tax=Emiliania huxleyi TaxID=2903 RepID=A0A0D3JK74_EMIH1|nr:hypothetical protein EMIHUDRAFT_206887 [Emiliania huxleyi CCMP1516]EOD23909.1 hypothetical protein EMIHUDRAFT_206887 [Emiliania huxleyi CCMP1516]|eukprot:XP_005776338.1 hypothetical protein EMIHUDRAFT_206887 [Emiliania huxleyi CCMP1516]